MKESMPFMSYVDLGIGVGLTHGLITETWVQPPVPTPSDVVELKEVPKSSRLIRTGKSMVRSGVVFGSSAALFSVGKTLSGDFFGEESALSHAFGGALGGVALSCRNGKMTGITTGALLGAASGFALSFYPDHHHVAEVNNQTFTRGPRRYEPETPKIA